MINNCTDDIKNEILKLNADSFTEFFLNCCKESQAELIKNVQKVLNDDNLDIRDENKMASTEKENLARFTKSKLAKLNELYKKANIDDKPEQYQEYFNKSKAVVAKVFECIHEKSIELNSL